MAVIFAASITKANIFKGLAQNQPFS